MPRVKKPQPLPRARSTELLAVLVHSLANDAGLPEDEALVISSVVVETLESGGFAVISIPYKEQHSR